MPQLRWSAANGPRGHKCGSARSIERPLSSPLATHTSKVRAIDEPKATDDMRIGNCRRGGVGSFGGIVVVTYVVGILSGPREPWQLPVPAVAISNGFVVRQPTTGTASVAETPKTLTTEEIAARCEKSIAIVSGHSSTGTGFLVRQCLLVTNGHVLSQERIEDVLVTFLSATSESMSADLVFEDPRSDLALLAVPTDLPPLEVASDQRLRRGQEVTVIGNPGIDNLVLKNAVSRGVTSTEVLHRRGPARRLATRLRGVRIDSDQCPRQPGAGPASIAARTRLTVRQHPRDSHAQVQPGESLDVRDHPLGD
jgi:Trypsin-like peptidase domain